MRGRTGENVTDEELESVRKRWAAATPGEWKAFVEGRDHTSGSSFIMRREGATRYEDLELSGATVADFDFIANAKQDILALLEEIARLKAARGPTGPASP